MYPYKLAERGQKKGVHTKRKIVRSVLQCRKTMFIAMYRHTDTLFQNGNCILKLFFFILIGLFQKGSKGSDPKFKIHIVLKNRTSKKFLPFSLPFLSLYTNCKFFLFLFIEITQMCFFFSQLLPDLRCSFTSLQSKSNHHSTNINRVPMLYKHKMGVGMKSSA